MLKCNKRKAEILCLSTAGLIPGWWWRNRWRGMPPGFTEELAAPLFTDSKNDKAKKRYERAAMIFLIFIICTGAVYAIWQQNKNANTICVYWANDHYEQVSCNEEAKGRIIIPINPEKLRSFRRITQEDTITEWSVGKVYYIKDSNIIKYYMDAGMYPEDLNGTLKVVSKYIYQNHLRKKETHSKDTLGVQSTKGIK